MKMYTNRARTAKLIELGFEKPMSIEVYRDGHCVPFVEQQWAYSISELIEMLKPIKNLRISVDNSYNCLEDLIVKRLVVNKWEILFGAVGNDLIDLLFSAIVKLKEEGVI